MVETIPLVRILDAYRSRENPVYASFPEVNVELYTDKKNLKLEKRLQKIFNSHEVYWQVYDLLAESGNDNEEYDEIATQEDFDNW